MSALPSGWELHVNATRVGADADADKERERCRRWKTAFVARVLLLCPDVNPDAADEASDAAINAGLTPRAAADLWVARQGPIPPAHSR